MTCFKFVFASALVRSWMSPSPIKRYTFVWERLSTLVKLFMLGPCNLWLGTGLIGMWSSYGHTDPLFEPCHEGNGQCIISAHQDKLFDILSEILRRPRARGESERGERERDLSPLPLIVEESRVPKYNESLSTLVQLSRLGLSYSEVLCDSKQISNSPSPYLSSI